MGNTELALLLKFGVPLAVKLLNDGKDEDETIEFVKTAIVNLEGGNTDLGSALVNADNEQTKNIIDGLFGVITGVGDAVGGLIKAFFRLFGGG